MQQYAWMKSDSLGWMVTFLQCAVCVATIKHTRFKSTKNIAIAIALPLAHIVIVVGKPSEKKNKIIIDPK